MTQNTCQDCRGSRFYIGLYDKEPCRTCNGIGNIPNSENDTPSAVCFRDETRVTQLLRNGWFVRDETRVTQLLRNGEVLAEIQRVKYRNTEWSATLLKSKQTSIHKSKRAAQRYVQKALGFTEDAAIGDYVFRDYRLDVHKLEDGKWEWRFKNQRGICNNPKTADDMASGALHNEIVSSLRGRACDPFVNCTIVSVAYRNVTLFVDRRYINDVNCIVRKLVPHRWSVNVIDASETELRK